MALLKTGGFPGYTIDQSGEAGLNQVTAASVAITANPGGGQPNGVLLDSQYNKVGVCATAGIRSSLSPPTPWPLALLSMSRTWARLPATCSQILGT